VDVSAVHRGSLDGFVARRTALVRELRSIDPGAAVAAGKLRKPSVTAWAIDQVAFEEPALVTELLAAGADALQSQRAATAEGGSAEDLLVATGRLRDAVEATVRAATQVLDNAGHAIGEDPVRRIRITLHAVAGGSPDQRLALWRGTLDRDLAPSGFGSLDGDVDDAPELADAVASLRRATPRTPSGSSGARARPEDSRRRRAAGREAANQQAAAERARATAAVKRREAQRLAELARVADDSATAAEDAAMTAEESARKAQRELG
jgi:hypothetical protein